MFLGIDSREIMTVAWIAIAYLIFVGLAGPDILWLVLHGFWARRIVCNGGEWKRGR